MSASPDLLWFLLDEDFTFSHGEAIDVIETSTDRMQTWGKRYLNALPGGMLREKGKKVLQLVSGGGAQGNPRRYTAHGITIMRFAFDFADAGIESRSTLPLAIKAYADLIRGRLRAGVAQDEIASEIANTFVLLRLEKGPDKAEVELFDMRDAIAGEQLVGPAPALIYPAGMKLLYLMKRANVVAAERLRKEKAAARERAEAHA